MLVEAPVEALVVVLAVAEEVGVDGVVARLVARLQDNERKALQSLEGKCVLES